jgi:polyhydroxyalkanoate synthesis repressor PhaR
MREEQLHKTVARFKKTAYFFYVHCSQKRGRPRRHAVFAGVPVKANGSMAKSDSPVIIKKYANRRLYNTGTSTYVTLEDLASMLKTGEDFVVYDAKTGEDITRSVLTQIIFEQENKQGQNLLPITFLRQLIRFYGDSMQMLVPRYLESSLDLFAREQEKFREQMAQAWGVGRLGTIEDQVKRNMDMFQRAFTMFTPFAATSRENGEGIEGAIETPENPAAEIDDLKRQLEEMRKRLERLSESEKLGEGENKS